MIRPFLFSGLTCKHGLDCLVEDPATGLHRPRNYLQSLEMQNTYLENRLAYLERILKDTRPDVAIDHLETRPAEANDLVHRSPGDASSANLPPDVVPPGADMLSSEVALLCLSATGREPQYFGPSSALSFSRIASTVMGLPKHAGRGDSTVRSQAGPEEPRSPSQAETPRTRSKSRLVAEFPSASRLKRLSQAYFQNIHSQYPFLHRPTIEMMENKCIDANLKGEITDVDDMSLFFVLMVSAFLSSGHWRETESLSA